MEYIRSETGVVAVLKGDKYEPLHLVLHHTRTEALAAARSLALNLIETIRAELAQWTLAQNAAQAATSVSAPSMTTSSVPQPVPPPAVTSTMTAPPVLSTSTPTMMSPVVSVASATAPLMTVRQPPTVLQLLPPQQQYVLNQENGQLIPIVQQGMQPNSFQSFSHPLGGLQQQNFGTQYVDISGMQPLTQLRLSGVPSSMSMILPNGLTLPSGSWTGATDTTTVSSAMSTPVVCAAQNTNSAQKILYSTDKIDKDTVQWAMPGSQTMIIPYQQLQELAANQAGLANIQQQYVSVSTLYYKFLDPFPIVVIVM